MSERLSICVCFGICIWIYLWVTAEAVTGTHTEATIDDVVRLLTDAKKIIVTSG